MAFTKIEDQQNLKLLNELISERILVVDGAMGTALENMNPNPTDFGGEEFVGCNELLNEFAPLIVKKIHTQYIEAGADIIETNSFNGSSIVMNEYGIEEKSNSLAQRSAELAREAIDECGLDRPVFVMGSMGPGTKSISVTGGTDFDEIHDVYYQYAHSLLLGGADLLTLETVLDTLNLKAALQGVFKAQRDLDRAAPIFLSVTIEIGGTMLAGQNIEALYHTFSGQNIFSIGLNCATGPALMSDHLRTLAELSHFPVTVWPNAGLPDQDGNYDETPDDFYKTIGRFASEGLINIAGGCCGTTAGHIQAICKAVKGITPRRMVENGNYPALAGSEPMVVTEDLRPVYIGERTNSIGSRRFKRLIREEKWEEAAEIGRRQVRKGAMVLDICTSDPDREEIDDYLRVLRPLQRRVRVPTLIDTTDTKVVEAALKNVNGKPGINSVNLEDGGERIREVAALAKKYGASLICGLIDEDREQGMAVTVERKLEVAQNIYQILKSEFGIPDTDIIFDPLVFPCATGDKNYLGSARETIDGTLAIKKKFPRCLTVLGISNVSFGLPPAGREVVNSVFLHLCVEAGLDMAIVNTQKLKRYPLIPQSEVDLATRLLNQGDKDTITEFAAFYRDTKPISVEDEWEGLTTLQRVARAVIEARKDGLEDNVKELLESMPPLHVINGPLMEGMSEVGRLFGKNDLIVAEVLESAEIMKAAVDIVKPYFPPGESISAKGKMVLATVKGDVHDIGKNLVDMIVSNNGFDIVNLGIKIPPEEIIQAVKDHQPDFIGLSGLLVKSAQQMVHTAKDLSAAGIDIPLLVGGAALTKNFVRTKIIPAYIGPVFYASNAMDGLELCNKIVDDSQYPILKSEWKELKSEEIIKSDSLNVKKDFSIKPMESPVWIETDVKAPPDLEEHLYQNISVNEVFLFISDQMLYGKHLGVTQLKKRMNDPNDSKLLSLREKVERVTEWAEKEGIFAPRGIYQWFNVKTSGESLTIIDSNGKQSASFEFPRQNKLSGISAVDWIRPEKLGGDSICMFVVTSGNDTTDAATSLRADGRFLDSHILQSVGIELAEATAEWIHQKIRSEWGYADPDETTNKDLFRTNYRGIRLSFGYPACPDLNAQQDLFRVLAPERVGVNLTEGMMMSPEGSVSALVFHHPNGRYYSI